MDEYLFDTEEFDKKGLTYYVLVIYDITSNKRRTRLAKLMKSFGFRVQKSAFEAHLQDNKYKKLLNALNPFVKEEDGDSIRVYKIRGKGAVTVLGKDDSAEEEDVIII